MAVMTKTAKAERVYSHPTMCLHCHLIVEMSHERGADPVKGAWECPRCAHKYLFFHWKIKKQVREKPKPRNKAFLGTGTGLFPGFSRIPQVRCLPSFLDPFTPGPLLKLPPIF